MVGSSAFKSARKMFTVLFEPFRENTHFSLEYGRGTVNLAEPFSTFRFRSVGDVKNQHAMY